MRRPTWSRLLPLALAAVAVPPLLGGCGGDAHPSIDRSSPMTVYAAVMEAVSRGDLERVLTLSSKVGQERIRKNLEGLRQAITDPKLWPLTRQAWRTYYGEVPEAEVEAARQGTAADVFRLFLKVDPRPAAPRWAEPPQISKDERQLRVVYELPRPQGTVEKRTVLLVKTHLGWFVEDLEL